MLNLKERTGLSNKDIARLLNVEYVRKPLRLLAKSMKEVDTCAFGFTGTVTC
jgi:hypothetical protein